MSIAIATCLLFLLQGIMDNRIRHEHPYKGPGGPSCETKMHLSVHQVHEDHYVAIQGHHRNPVLYGKGGADELEELAPCAREGGTRLPE